MAAMDYPTGPKTLLVGFFKPSFRPVGVKGFVILPNRWIVERTFAWFACYRRHSKDYEKTPESSEAFTYISMIALMSKRLATA